MEFLTQEMVDIMFENGHLSTEEDRQGRRFNNYIKNHSIAYLSEEDVAAFKAGKDVIIGVSKWPHFNEAEFYFYIHPDAKIKTDKSGKFYVKRGELISFDPFDGYCSIKRKYYFLTDRYEDTKTGQRFLLTALETACARYVNIVGVYEDNMYIIPQGCIYGKHDNRRFRARETNEGIIEFACDLKETRPLSDLVSGLDPHAKRAYLKSTIEVLKAELDKTEKEIKVLENQEERTAIMLAKIEKLKQEVASGKIPEGIENILT